MPLNPEKFPAIWTRKFLQNLLICLKSCLIDRVKAKEEIIFPINRVFMLLHKVKDYVQQNNYNKA